MTSNKISPLIKRIKRHVSGPVQHFFAVTAPGFESICRKELETLSSDIKDIKQEEGGVEFTGKLYGCYLANMYLRTANRILMRLTEFSATNFRKLEKKLNDFPWELYIYRESTPEINVASRHSRLYHSDAIAERVTKSIEARKTNTPFESSIENDIQTQKIFIRLIDDTVTISLDSSGELLYRRGIKQHGGAAPVRETLAAGAVMLSDYKGDEPLLDPMCGTGTFSIEAAMIARNIPPGLKRSFAFESWPAFKPAQWDHIKKEAEEKSNTEFDKHPIVACDMDTAMCEALKKTLCRFGLKKTVKVLNEDFFNISPADIQQITGVMKTGLIIINPPYGVRLGTPEKSVKMFFKITGRLKKHFNGWKFALFLPVSWPIEKCGLSGEKLLLDHGGLKLALFTGIIPEKN